MARPTQASDESLLQVSVRLTVSARVRWLVGGFILGLLGARVDLGKVSEALQLLGF
ncbi:hypothetical protein [Nonomuraea endophytica]|uniref:Uncharacterized protein n=1 Tax=Nonomuraea endophytica TaxID=714136 RepID=A0A7W8A0W4_9ACTN|nr:hypothetical protein [Nonomuraea endophytica]MBB5077505.1 hypothetical protein [Nonomuraea endophytica]